MYRSLAATIVIASVCVVSSVKAQQTPTPSRQEIVDEAVKEARKNLQAFDEANKKPIGEARQELEDIFDRLVGDPKKTDEAKAVLKQLETLEADALRMAKGDPNEGLKPPVKRVVEKAAREVEKNWDICESANRKPLSAAREKLKGLAQAEKKVDLKAANATLQQLETLAQDVISLAMRPAQPVAPPAAGEVLWNGHRYKAVNIRGKMVGIDWPTAKAKCEQMGGYLACGETPAEIQFLTTLSIGAWTGAHKDKQGKWFWISGPALDNAPQGDKADCGFATTANGGLLARPQDGVRGTRTWVFICEWDNVVALAKPAR